MSLMGALYVGASGIQTGQNALNTTAHNMSNIDTVGYTRQQVQQGTRFYNTISKTNSANAYQQIGLGVNYSNVKQVRDYFLDKSYRRESGRGAFYETSFDAIEEMENLFQELEGEAFADAIDNLWVSVQELNKDASDATNQGIFIQRCGEFISRAQGVYQGLSNYQDNLNLQIKDKIETMNSYGDRIKDLNDQILKIESAGFEQANDLRDERNSLIDELSQMANISVDDDIEGNKIIKVEGVEFVSADSCNHMELSLDEVTGFYTPYWKQLAKPDGLGGFDISSAKVFDLTQDISTDTNTDIGKIKAMLLARGDKRATYEDVATEAAYKEVSESVVMNVMAEFDQLINKVASSINKVFTDNAANWKTEWSGTLGPGGTTEYKIFDTKSGEKLSVMNLMVAEDVKQAPSLLSFMRTDDKVDQNAADALKGIFTEEIYTLNPEVKTKTNFVNYYNNLISQVANTGSVLKGISENQVITVDNISNAREQILGVSADEELGNMIMFQNAFNASSRYINVVSQMLEHLLTSLG